MSVLSLIVRELIGMFIDDEFLAIAILAVVAATALLIFAFGAPPLVAGAVLPIGCIAVLLRSVASASRK